MTQISRREALRLAAALAVVAIRAPRRPNRLATTGACPTMRFAG
jgi:hypothetical protein